MTDENYFTISKMDLSVYDNLELNINNVRSPLRSTHKEELYKYFNNIPYDAYWLNINDDSVYFLDHRTGNKMFVVDKSLYNGIVLYTGNADSDYMVVKILDIDSNYFFTLAQNYVLQHNLPWNIIPPLSWSFHNLGMHITINTDIQFINQNVQVKLGKMVHFSSPKSNWVAIQVELENLSCPRVCHVSIGQEVKI